MGASHENGITRPGFFGTAMRSYTKGAYSSHFGNAGGSEDGINCEYGGFDEGAATRLYGIFINRIAYWIIRFSKGSHYSPYNYVTILIVCARSVTGGGQAGVFYNNPQRKVDVADTFTCSIYHRRRSYS